MSREAQWTRNSINWRPGCWRPFESLACIGAKFCFLNKVGVQTFIEFLAEFVEKTTATGIQSESTRNVDVNTIMDDPTFRLRAFSRVFEEPVSTVRTSNISALVPRHSPDAPTLATRLCKRCVQDGYHAVFHQLPWFDQCLIHGEPLIDFQYAVQTGTKVYRHIAAIHTVLFGPNSTWNFSSISAWRCPNRRGHFGPAKAYQGWLEQTSDQTIVSRHSILCLEQDAGFTNCRTPRCAELIFCMGQASPVPRQVSIALTEKRIESHPLSRDFPLGECTPDSVSMLIAPHQSADISSLIDLRIIEREIQDESPPWWDEIQAQFSCLIKHHAQCEKDLVEVMNDPRFHWADYDFPPFHTVCSRIYSARRFHQLWVAPRAKNFRHREFGETWTDWCSRVGRIFQKHGFVFLSSKQIIVLDEKGQEKDYELKFWKMKSPWREICDQILLDMVIGTCWHLFELEKETPIEAKTAPISSRYFLPLISFQVLNGDTLRMLRWRRSPAMPPDWSEQDADPIGHRLAVESWKSNVEHKMLDGWFHHHKRMTKPHAS